MRGNNSEEDSTLYMLRIIRIILFNSFFSIGLPYSKYHGWLNENVQNKFNFSIRNLKFNRFQILLQLYSLYNMKKSWHKKFGYGNKIKP